MAKAAQVLVGRRFADERPLRTDAADVVPPTRAVRHSDLRAVLAIRVSVRWQEVGWLAGDPVLEVQSTAVGPDMVTFPNGVD